MNVDINLIHMILFGYVINFDISVQFPFFSAYFQLMSHPFQVIFEGVYALHPDIRESIDLWIAVVRLIVYLFLSEKYSLCFLIGQISIHHSTKLFADVRLKTLFHPFSNLFLSLLSYFWEISIHH